MMSRRLSIVFMILVALSSSGGALARDGGDRHGGVFKGGHVRGEHFEGSRHRNDGEFEFSAGSPFFGLISITGLTTPILPIILHQL